MSQSELTRRQMIGGLGSIALASGSTGATRSANGRVQLGAIGVGNRGREHLRTIRSGGFPCDVAAICDIVPEHAAKAAEVAGGSPKIYEDYRELLDHEGLTAVLIATPNFLHKEMVIAALERGLDVLCEKPLALNVAECDEMIRAWRSTQSVFMVGLQNRWHPCHLKVLEIIEQDVIGKVRHLAATEFRKDWKQITPGSTRISHVNWRHYDSLSGGSLLEKNCHDFDLFQYWTGSVPLRVCGFGGAGFYPGRESFDHASIVIEYDRALTVSLDFNIGSQYGKGFHEWMMVGDKGQLRFRRKGDSVQVTTWKPSKREEAIPIEFDARESGHNGTMGLLEEFFARLKDRGMPSSNPLAGRQSVKVAQAAQLAVRDRRVVDLGELGL